MRLIDADDLIDLLDDEFRHDRAFTAMNLYSIVNSATTIEARPTGKWKQDINGWHVCTNCHMQYRGMPTIDRKPRWQYCPTCGARMEAENET